MCVCVCVYIYRDFVHTEALVSEDDTYPAQLHEYSTVF